MQRIGLVRLGRVADVRTVAATRGESQPVANLSCAYNVWVKGEKETVWVDAALWGKRVETLAPYLKKGALLCVTIDGLRMESFTKRDGTASVKLTGMVTSVDLAGGAPASDAGALGKPAQAPAADPARARTQQDAMDDDIPFN